MVRQRRAILIGAALAAGALLVAVLVVSRSAGDVDGAVPATIGARGADDVAVLGASTVLPGADDGAVLAPTTTTTSTVAGGTVPAGGAPHLTSVPAPASGRPAPGTPTTAPAADDTPVLLAIDAPAPATPVRPSGAAAVARQRFVTVDAKATVDQLMGDRVETVAGGYRRAGKAVKLRLFEDPPVRLEPVANYVKESGAAPTANGVAPPTLTTYSWMGTTASGPPVTASVIVTRDSTGAYALTGTITTSGDTPPLQLDHVDGDRYALTQLTTGIPCQPEVVGTSGIDSTSTTAATTTTTTDPACAH